MDHWFCIDSKVGFSKFSLSYICSVIPNPHSQTFTSLAFFWWSPMWCVKFCIFKITFVGWWSHVQPITMLWKHIFYFFSIHKIRGIKCSWDKKRFQSGIDTDGVARGTIPEGKEVWPTRWGKENRFHLWRRRCCGRAIQQHSKHM